jgi:competence protein ComEC
MTALRTGGIVPRGVSLGVGAIAIILFALMTGGSATVVRASLMALLVILARATGRTYDLTKALCIAGVLMVLHSPYILAFDPSFQLSFVATLGLILLGPRLDHLFVRIPQAYGFREFTVATIATQLFVLPLLLYQNGTLSLVSLPANLLVLAVVPLAMLVGFLAGILGLLSVYLAYPFAFAAYALLTYILFIATNLARIPFATVTIPFVSFWVMVVMYGVLALLVVRLYQARE